MRDVLSSPILEPFPWLDHGFGTRQAPLSQGGMASLKQIHSSLSLVADRREGCVGEGDALLTGEAGVTVSIRTADCLPILLADSVTRAVAAVHAGWRGTHAHIVKETIERMRSEFGSAAANIVAAIGPGIGACCYEGRRRCREAVRDGARRAFGSCQRERFAVSRRRCSAQPDRRERPLHILRSRAVLFVASRS